ncbi:MAG: metallophosphoesterase [Clostridia bacterium]|nr:metallophosphoesterase [Clostridia bacterium]
MRLYEESLQLLNRRKGQLSPIDYNIVYLGDSWVEKINVPHYSYTSNEIFAAALNEAKKFNPLFIMHGGDIVFTGSRELLENFIVVKNELVPDIPLFVTIGNHELEPTPSGPWSPENFLSIIGPLHFLLNVPEYQLTMIALNTLYHFVYNEYGLTAEELKFLRQSLQQSLHNTFVATHVPPQSSEWSTNSGTFTINREPFLHEIKDKASIAFVSHVHAYDTAEIEDTRFVLSGCAGAPPNVNQVNHIVVVNVRNEGGRSRIRFKKVPVGWT